MSSGPRVCPVCGLLVSPEARFCSQCGTRLDGNDTESVFRSPRRLFGVLARAPILVLAAILLLAGVLALVVGSPVAAIVLLALAAASLVLFYGAVERDPADPVARRVLTLADRMRNWIAFAGESLRAWAGAVKDVARLTTESRSLRRERTRTVYALGDAAYRDDAEAVAALRSRLSEIDQGLLERRRAREASVAKARRRVHEEHVAVQPTQQFGVRDLTSGGER